MEMRYNPLHEILNNIFIFHHLQNKCQAIFLHVNDLKTANVKAETCQNFINVCSICNNKFALTTTEAVSLYTCNYHSNAYFNSTLNVLAITSKFHPVEIFFLIVKLKVKVKLTIEQTMKARRGVKV
jgi:hypothetical protein